MEECDPDPFLELMPKLGIPWAVEERDPAEAIQVNTNGRSNPFLSQVCHHKQAPPTMLEARKQLLI